MREYIGVEVVANLVSMLASNRKGAIWVSDSDEEASFYESRCAHESAIVLPAPSQAGAVLHLLNRRGIKGVIATVPPDSNGLEDGEFSLTAGDVVSLLVFSTSCLRVLREAAGRFWYDAATSATGGFREHAQKIASFLQILKTDLRIDLDDRTRSASLLDEVINWTSFRPDKARRPTGITQERWETIIAAVDTIQPACCGEDLLVVFAGAVQNFRPRGIYPKCEFPSNIFFSMLKVGYDITEFENDELYWKLKMWQRVNRFPVLREWRSLDELGVLLNQQYWEKDLIKLLTRSDTTIALFKLDLDNFKSVNEQLGHVSGDEAIRLYARTIKDEIGLIAEVYRRGGDEVVAFAPLITEADAREAAESLRRAIEMNFQKWSREKGLASAPTASIGVVCCTSSNSYEDVIKALEGAQLEAKHSGKNRVIHVAMTCPR